ncbi:MAG: site-2 protease family protein, partial [Candidatus Paceibacterota bacterium]
MTIILFIAVLVFLIWVHELGHFLAAKWARMRVDEFAIGFPPRIFAVKKGETEYSLNLLPIGGYVRIFGENGSEETSEGDRSRAFGLRPRHLQAIVLVAGVAMNILAAWLIFFAVAMIGSPAIVEEFEASDKSSLTVVAIMSDSPSDEAEVPLGAVIKNVRSGDQAIESLTPSSVSNFVTENSESEIQIDYTHKGNDASITLTPQRGLIENEPERAVIGLSSALVETVRQNPLEALVGATVRTYESLIAITIGITTFLASAVTLSADVSQVTGPIGIAGMVGDAAEFGIVSLLIFTAFISLNLAVINLLPIPALDGGRLVFVAIEAITRRSIGDKWVGRVNLVGFVFLILLMIAVTYNDI